jgi:hypothetical protein
MRILRVVARVLFFAYAAMLLGVGAAGIFTARWELTRVFHVDVVAMSPMDGATFLSQYRFLKALELGLGVFCFAYRRRIFTERSFNRFFLFFVLAGVAARSLSLIADGWARWPFIAFLLLELGTAAAVFAYPRPALTHAPAAPAHPSGS